MAVENTKKRIISILLVILVVAVLLGLWFGPSLVNEPGIDSSETVSGTEFKEREEIRYVIEVQCSMLERCEKRLARSIQKLQIIEKGKNDQAHSVRFELDVPRMHYLEFVQNIQQLGKLSLKRERYLTKDPSDLPVPFVLTLSESRKP